MLLVRRAPSAHESAGCGKRHRDSRVSRYLQVDAGFDNEEPRKLSRCLPLDVIALWQFLVLSVGTSRAVMVNSLYEQQSIQRPQYFGRRGAE